MVGRMIEYEMETLREENDQILKKEHPSCYNIIIIETNQR